MEHVDVAIVGGGPGGTSAAHAAARHGADAVVLEKRGPQGRQGTAWAPTRRTRRGCWTTGST